MIIVFLLKILLVIVDINIYLIQTPIYQKIIHVFYISQKNHVIPEKDVYGNRMLEKIVKKNI